MSILSIMSILGPNRQNRIYGNSIISILSIMANFKRDRLWEWHLFIHYIYLDVYYVYYIVSIFGRIYKIHKKRKY